jgi:DHA1 family multidrug resistance protein-like MFS transporter
MASSDAASESWRRNLYTIAIVEFVVLMAFGFANPFMPLFIQGLGNFTDREAAFWTGLSTSAFAICMLLTGPVWGILADRWGRKPMVLRAMFGAAALSAAIGIAPNVYWVVGLRGAQGLFSGSLAAASALVASNTPRDKIPFAMGLLMVALYGGSTLGPLIGGIMVDAVGYKASFFIIGAVYFLGGLAVIFFTKEKFKPAAKGQGASVRGLVHLAMSRQMRPLLAVICILFVGPSIMMPTITLLIKELGVQSNTASVSGLAFSLMGIVATISSIVAVRMASRISLKKMLVISCLGTGLLNLPPMWAPTVTLFIILMALRGTLSGGLMIPSNSLIALSVSQSEQGMAYGLQQSANSLGNTLGPLIGAGLASLIGLKAVFPAAAALFILAGVAAVKLLPDLSEGELPVDPTHSSHHEA